MHIDHINIAAPFPLLEAVRDFYCRVLGLEDGFRPKFAHRGFWLYSGDAPLVHLSERAVPGSSRERGHLDHIAFRSRGLRAMIARLETNGVDHRSSYIEEFNMTQLFFEDPVGNGIEVNFPDES